MIKVALLYLIFVFNGEDFTGWWGCETEDPAKWMALSEEELAAKKVKSMEDIRKHWKVVDGVLENDGKGADSGVYLRGIPQVQIWDPKGKHPDAHKGSGILNDKIVVKEAPLQNHFDKGGPIPGSGPIQLQTHGAEISWRNVELREL